MQNSVLGMIYEAVKADDEGALSSDIQGEEFEEYGKMLEMIQEKFGEVGPVIDIEQTIWELLLQYEKRAYIEGLKKGFKLAEEVKEGE